jgi:hypothetical protein
MIAAGRAGLAYLPLSLSKSAFTTPDAAIWNV